MAATSQYFQKPVPTETLSQEVLRKMIKCCTTLKCFTQVAVLCQFMESVDHAAAFKALQEKMWSVALQHFRRVFFSLFLFDSHDSQTINWSCYFLGSHHRSTPRGMSLSKILLSIYSVVSHSEQSFPHSTCHSLFCHYER